MDQQKSINLSWVRLTILVFILDRLTKYFVVEYAPFEKARAIADHLNLFFTYNAGAAFSLLKNAGGWQQWLLGGIAIVVSLLIINWLVRLLPGQVWTSTSLTLILSGTLGNLYDRVFYHHVVDFIDFYIYPTWPHWPAFNIADSAICIGVIMLLLDFICNGKKPVA